MAIRSLYVTPCVREYGLPRQCAHWLAMTVFESTARGRRDDVGIVPYEVFLDQKGGTKA